MTAPDPDVRIDGARRARIDAWAPWVVLLFAAALRLWFAGRKGLVLDEFHSYFHATRDGLRAFFDTLALDNHPPLSFLVIGMSRSLFGESELALRMPAIGFGVLEIVLVARLVRRVAPDATPWIASALLAVSSLHLDFSTQARMYALHALCVTGLAEAVLALVGTERPRRWSAVLVVLWCLAGLHNHYFFLQYVGVTGAVVLCTLAASRALRPRLKRLVTPGLVVVLLASPWYAWGFRTQLGHALPPGGDDVGLRALSEAFVHLFFLNVRLGGPLRLVFVMSGVMLTILAAVGALGLLLRARSAEERLAPLVLAAIALAVPVAAVLAAAIFPRAGFTWHYILPSAAAEAVLLAAFVRHDARRRFGVGLFAAAALLLCVLNAASHGTERYPEAVRHIVSTHEPGDAVISVEWQPALFPQGQPWDYYAPRLSPTPPARLAMNAAFDVADPRALARFERVLLLRTSLPGDQHLMRRLQEYGQVAARAPFGFGIEVLVFERH